MPRFSNSFTLNRRAVIVGAASAAASLIAGRGFAAPSGFSAWVAEFRGRATARGISPQTYARVMNSLEPDMSVFDQFNAQPEFTQAMWQYINRRCSEWRVITGKERAK